MLSVYLHSLVSVMESLNTFESEMEADGQGNYSLFPALDSIASLSGTPETLERLFLSNTSQSHTSGLGYLYASAMHSSI